MADAGCSCNADTGFGTRPHKTDNPALIRPTQGRSADRLIAEVVSVVPLTSRRRLNVPQAPAATQLANRQCHKLRPARQSVAATLAVTRDLPASRIQVSAPILVAGKVRYYGTPWPDSSPVFNELVSQHHCNKSSRIRPFSLC